MIEKEKPYLIFVWKCWNCGHIHELKNGFKIYNGYVLYEGQCQNCLNPCDIKIENNSKL